MQKIAFIFVAIVTFGLTAFGQRAPIGDYMADNMQASSIIAGSSTPDAGAPGGFGPSDNYPRSVKGKDFPRDAISLAVNPDEEVAYGEYHGIRLLLANTTNTEMWLSATDSRLNIIQEALDTDGTWKPIESMPRAWCGNSYHRVRLGAGEYWQLVAPRYSGGFKTKLRFKLEIDQKRAVYSNEFAGSVNRGQFVPPKNKHPF